MALKSSLISYWPLNEASGNALDLVGGNTLTETSGTIDSAAGVITTSRDFEAGDTEYFTIADNAALSVGNIDFSIQVWFNQESSAADQVLLGKWNAVGGLEYLIWYDNTASRITFSVTDDGTVIGAHYAEVEASALGEPATGTWYHIIAGHDSVNNILFIQANGGTRNTNPHTTGVFDGVNNFNIGRADTAGAEKYFDGRMCEVAFWKRVVTSAEAVALYNGGAGLAFDQWDAGQFNYELASGPPMRGAPFIQRLPIEPASVYLPPGSMLSIGGNPSAAPEISSGPALLGAPWARVLLTDGLMQPPNGGAAPDVVLPAGPGRGKQRPFFRRAPRPSEPDYNRRMAQITEKQMSMLNSLIRQGVLAQVSADEWILRTGGFSAARAPLASDDDTDGIQIGSIWTDTSGLVSYVCVDNTTQAAVWKQIT